MTEAIADLASSQLRVRQTYGERVLISRAGLHLHRHRHGRAADVHPSATDAANRTRPSGSARLLLCTRLSPRCRRAWCAFDGRSTLRVAGAASTSARPNAEVSLQTAERNHVMVRRRSAWSLSRSRNAIYAAPTAFAANLYDGVITAMKLPGITGKNCALGIFSGVAAQPPRIDATLVLSIPGGDRCIAGRHPCYCSITSTSG